MAEDAWQPFAKLIARGDVAGVVAALEALDEPARKRLSTNAKRAAKEVGWGRSRHQDAAQAAQFGTGGAVAAVRQWWIPGDDETVRLRERLVRSRSRSWRQDWAERSCSRESDGWAWADWALVHRMVKDGSIDRPVTDGYVVGAVTALPDWSWPRKSGARPLAEILRAEPAWLQRDLWELFAIEETGLTSADGSDAIWRTALVALAAEGLLPRERLLDESLGALRRDFAPHHARWYQRLFAALEPATDELDARVDDLLALLADPHAANVAFALRALAELQRAGRLPADRFLDAVGPAFMLPAKGHATRAVKLAGRVLRGAPEHARGAVPVLLGALAHEARDVQAAAVDVLERHATALGADELTRLADVADTLDPALRGRAAALTDASGLRAAAGADASRDEPVPAAVVIPGRREHDFGAPRLRADDALVPVRDADELLDRAATALERGDDPDEIELVLDAISRLRDTRPDPARATALSERAMELTFAWNRTYNLTHARDALSMALLCWLRPRHTRATVAALGRCPVEAIAQRLRELLADLGRRQPRALLATPTHRGGWVDAAQAVRRVAALEGARPLVMDLAQLVLRIAPDGREHALQASRGLRGEAGGVLQHALGGDTRRPWLAKLGPAWDAAGDARDPAGHVAPQPDFNDLTGLRAPFGRTKTAALGAHSPAALAELEESWWGWEANGLERWLTRVWPARRDGALLVVCRRLWANAGAREHGIGDVLEVLLDPAEPLVGHGALALALGLGAADATDRTLAADITIAALCDRRLDGAMLGGLLAGILRDQDIQPSASWGGTPPPDAPRIRAVPSRWATALADVASAGALQAHDVQVAIETVFAAAAPDDRRRLLVLVDVLRQLCVEADAAVTHPGARSWLEALPPRSKTGRAARETLSVTGDGAARSRRAASELGSPGRQTSGASAHSASE